MSKQYKIEWNENQLQELKRTVKNFNAKVRRLEKQYDGTNVILPEKVSVKELRELIGTNRDLKRELNSLQRFSKRGAETIETAPISEENLQITKWQRIEMNRRQGIINRKRDIRREQIKEIPMSFGGQPLGYNVGDVGMGKAEEISLSHTNAFTEKMDKYELKKKFRSLRKHSQSDYFTKSDERLLNNYKEALKETYGEEAVKDILEAIDKMSFNEFYKTFRAEPGAFEFASDIPNDADIEAYLEKIESTWIPKKSNVKKSMGNLKPNTKAKFKGAK